MKKKLRVMVLMGGKSPEHEVSISSGNKVTQSLNTEKFEVIPLVISKEGKGFETIVESKPDVVFIAIHGPYGEDGTVQGMLEMIGIPYTGAGVLASAIGMDKEMFKKVMAGMNIRVAKSITISKNDDENIILEKFSLPVVVKPSSQGSSVGVSIVHKEEDLKKALEKSFHYGPKIIVEEFLPGMEVSCGVLGNKNPVALPVIEIVPKNEFFDYQAKYESGKSEEVVPARISEELTKKVQEMAIRVYKAVDCRGFGRIDMIISKGEPYVLEINTIPGLTPASLLPKEAATAGITYPELIEKLIDFALEK